MSDENMPLRLRELGLHGMAEGFEHQKNSMNFLELAFERRLSHLVDNESAERTNRRIARILKSAKLKISADPDDTDYREGRGLAQSIFAELLELDWVSRHQNVILTGPTGTGKTWLACALGTQCARRCVSVRYFRAAQLLLDLRVARESGALVRLRTALQRTEVLILDDFGLAPMSAQGRQDLLDVLDDRTETGSVVISGQLPVKEWHSYIDDPAVADAILDRLAHSSHRLELAGESMRRLKGMRGSQ